MPKLREVTHRDFDGPVAYSFVCPGCNMYHSVYIVQTDNHAVWGFNGNTERPTFSPSILARWEQWDDDRQETARHVCHSFVREGRIQFLNDCTHELRGQTVALPDVDD